MKKKWLPILIVALLLPSVSACSMYSRHHYYRHASAYARMGMDHDHSRNDHRLYGERRSHGRSHSHKRGHEDYRR